MVQTAYSSSPDQKKLTRAAAHSIRRDLEQQKIYPPLHLADLIMQEGDIGLRHHSTLSAQFRLHPLPDDALHQIVLNALKEIRYQQIHNYAEFVDNASHFQPSKLLPFQLVGFDEATRELPLVESILETLGIDTSRINLLVLHIKYQEGQTDYIQAFAVRFSGHILWEDFIAEVLPDNISPASIRAIVDKVRSQVPSGFF